MRHGVILRRSAAPVAAFVAITRPGPGRTAPRGLAPAAGAQRRTAKGGFLASRGRRRSRRGRKSPQPLRPAPAPVRSPSRRPGRGSSGETSPAHDPVRPSASRGSTAGRSPHRRQKRLDVLRCELRPQRRRERIGPEATRSSLRSPSVGVSRSASIPRLRSGASWSAPCRPPASAPRRCRGGAASAAGSGRRGARPRARRQRAGRQRRSAATAWSRCLRPPP